MKPRICLIPALVACLAVGCASEPSVQHPPRLVYQSIDRTTHPAFRQVADELAPQALKRARVSVDPADATLADYHLVLAFEVRDMGISDAEAVWTMTTAILLTLYPSSCGRYELELTADLYDAGGERIKTWYELEQDTAFLWLMQGRDCFGEQSDDTVARIAGQMLGKLYKRIERDGVVSAQSDPGTTGPLVLVRADYARPIVERVVRTDEPFDRYTFDEGDADGAVRTVRIDFELHTPEQSVANVIGRGMGAMATLGLMGMCPPNEIVLVADVLAEDGSTLHSYRYLKKKRAGIADQCAMPSYQTHPKLYADLLHRLFRQMKRDGVA